MNFVRRVVARMRRLLRRPIAEPKTSEERWISRAEVLGERAVYHVGHSDAELESVTDEQRKLLIPLFASHLRPSDRVAVDFGCGPGRFTPNIAEVTGHAIGVDVVANFLEMAPRSVNCEYRRIDGGRIPVDDRAADVVWVCLVLGGLDDIELARAKSEILRVLRTDGLIFLVENTSTEKIDSAMWRFRSEERYVRLFQGATLHAILAYKDMGETITVFVGRTGA